MSTGRLAPPLAGHAVVGTGEIAPSLSTCGYSGELSLPLVQAVLALVVVVRENKPRWYEFRRAGPAPCPQPQAEELTMVMWTQENGQINQLSYHPGPDAGL